MMCFFLNEWLMDFLIGNSSIIADQIALKLVGPDGFVVTEVQISTTSFPLWKEIQFE